MQLCFILVHKRRIDHESFIKELPVIGLTSFGKQTRVQKGEDWLLKTSLSSPFLPSSCTITDCIS